MSVTPNDLNSTVDTAKVHALIEYLKKPDTVTQQQVKEAIEAQQQREELLKKFPDHTKQESQSIPEELEGLKIIPLETYTLEEIHAAAERVKSLTTNSTNNTVKFTVVGPTDNYSTSTGGQSI
jgi:crotonobetainyl-CoA:carnitine CoA-transferase CaiB-like acyl-CoA transferase